MRITKRIVIVQNGHGCGQGVPLPSSSSSSTNVLRANGTVKSLRQRAEARWKERGRLNEMRCDERREIPRGSFALRAKGAGRKMPSKNDAYDSPASARSSARSRSASTMANLRATCINDTHIRFLTCACLPPSPPPSSRRPRRLWKLRRRRDGETPASRRRRRSRDWKSYGVVEIFLSLRSKSADEHVTSAFSSRRKTMYRCSFSRDSRAFLRAQIKTCRQAKLLH